jgi:ferredoxin-type protein NapF
MDIVNKTSGTPTRPVSRFQFLQGDFTGKSLVIRPPWAVEESRFIELCTGCGVCIEHCPSAILRKGRAGYPVVDFRAGECDFCGECVSRCDTGALQPCQNETDAPWHLKAVIGGHCLALQNVICRACAEHCESRAIEFRLSAGRVPQPEVIESRCNGCGACYAPCPAHAITFSNTSG